VGRVLLTYVGRVLLTPVGRVLLAYVGRVLLFRPGAQSQHGPTDPRRSRLRSYLITSSLCLSVLTGTLWGNIAYAQTPAPAMERVTLEQAVTRALAGNPTVAQAAEAVLRAEGLLQQARAATMPAVNAFYTNATLDTGRTFNGVVVQPRNQSTISADLSVPVLAASRWAAASQARDQVEVANLSTADVRKQIGVATAQAYLAI